MTMGELITYFMIYFFEGTILWKYCTVLFVSENSTKNFLLIQMLYMVMYAVSLKSNLVINICFFIAVNFICISFLYQNRWYTALYHSLITTIAMSIGEFFVLCITMYSFPFYLHGTSLYSLIPNVIFSKTLYFLLLNGIMRFEKNRIDRGTHFDKIFLLIMITPILSVFVVVLLIAAILSLRPDLKLMLIITICGALILLFNLIFIGIYNYVLKKMDNITNLELLLQKEKAYAKYYKMLLSQEENKNILIHDMKKHLQAIALLNEKGEREKISSYIRQLGNSTALNSRARVSDNDILSAIVNRCKQDCIQKGITMHTDIRCNSIGFMHENDLTSLFGNLLDNAFASASMQEDSFIELNVQRSENADITVITMINSCRKNPFSEKTGRLISNKSDSGHHHGFGMKSIERTIKRYNGEVQVYYDDKNFTFHTIIFLKDTSL